MYGFKVIAVVLLAALLDQARSNEDESKKVCTMDCEVMDLNQRFCHSQVVYMVKIVGDAVVVSDGVEYKVVVTIDLKPNQVCYYVTTIHVASEHMACVKFDRFKSYLVSGNIIEGGKLCVASCDLHHYLGDDIPFITDVWYYSSYNQVCCPQEKKE